MIVLACLLAYIIGSIPNGLIVSRVVAGIDIRQYGSHNIGATNVWRTLGKGPGAAVFLLDFIKGILGVFFGYGYLHLFVHQIRYLNLFCL